MRRPWMVPVLLLAALGWTAAATGHDIPNARVDRSIQVTLRPGRLIVDYEVELAELTLTRDLRDLIGTLPDGDRQDWFQRYGQETGPLNGKGLLLTVDGRPWLLRSQGFDLTVEEHPRFTFHYDADLPAQGRLKVHDTNFDSSEGTSRLALRGQAGVAIQGDSLPSDVHQISPQPIWLLSDLEERRTKQAEVEFTTPDALAPAPTPAVPITRLSPAPMERKPTSQDAPAPQRTRSGAENRPGTDRLTRLFDRRTGVSLLGLALIAFGLGAAHSMQPGHGKTLVAATVVANQGSWFRGVLLALITTATHTGSVLLVALGLWLTRSTQYGSIHAALTFGAGFVIAAIGFWRLGRHLGGYGEHRDEDPTWDGSASGSRNLLGLGIAGGLIPCWDAVALILVGEAVGRLGTAVLLLIAFGLGMATVLMAVGWTAARCRQLVTAFDGGARAEHWLGIAGSLVLCVLGVYLLGSA